MFICDAYLFDTFQVIVHTRTRSIYDACIEHYWWMTDDNKWIVFHSLENLNKTNEKWIEWEWENEPKPVVQQQVLMNIYVCGLWAYSRFSCYLWIIEMEIARHSNGRKRKQQIKINNMSEIGFHWNGGICCWYKFMVKSEEETIEFSFACRVKLVIQ